MCLSLSEEDEAQMCDGLHAVWYQRKFMITKIRKKSFEIVS